MSISSRLISPEYGLFYRKYLIHSLDDYETYQINDISSSSNDGDNLTHISSSKDARATSNTASELPSGSLSNKRRTFNDKGKHITNDDDTNGTEIDMDGLILLSSSRNDMLGLANRYDTKPLSNDIFSVFHMSNAKHFELHIRLLNAYVNEVQQQQQQKQPVYHIENQAKLIQLKSTILDALMRFIRTLDSEGEMIMESVNASNNSSNNRDDESSNNNNNNNQNSVETKLKHLFSKAIACGFCWTIYDYSINMLKLYSKIVSLVSSSTIHPNNQALDKESISKLVVRSLRITREIVSFAPGKQFGSILGEQDELLDFLFNTLNECNSSSHADIWTAVADFCEEVVCKRRMPYDLLRVQPIVRNILSSIDQERLKSICRVLALLVLDPTERLSSSVNSSIEILNARYRSHGPESSHVYNNYIELSTIERNQLILAECPSFVKLIMKSLCKVSRVNLSPRRNTQSNGRSNSSNNHSNESDILLQPTQAPTAITNVNGQNRNVVAHASQIPQRRTNYLRAITSTIGFLYEGIRGIVGRIFRSTGRNRFFVQQQDEVEDNQVEIENDNDDNTDSPRLLSRHQIRDNNQLDIENIESVDAIADLLQTENHAAIRNVLEDIPDDLDDENILQLLSQSLSTDSALNHLEAMFVLSSLLASREKARIQNEVASLGFVPIVSKLLDLCLEHHPHLPIPRPHGENCECHNALKIQVLRLIHNFCDKEGGSDVKRLLLSKDEATEAGIKIESNMPGYNYIVKEEEHGLLHKLVESFMKISKSNSSKFWLATSIESYLRGSTSSERNLVIKWGLFDYVIDSILYEKQGGEVAKSTDSFQIYFDILSELIKFNRDGFFRFNQRMKANPEEFKMLMDHVMTRLIDSNVFIRSICLSIGKFSEYRDSEDFEFRARGIYLSYPFDSCILYRWFEKNVHIVLRSIMHAVTIDSVSQENICCINTILILIMRTQIGSQERQDLIEKVKSVDLQNLILEEMDTKPIETSSPCFSHSGSATNTAFRSRFASSLSPSLSSSSSSNQKKPIPLKGSFVSQFPKSLKWNDTFSNFAHLLWFWEEFYTKSITHDRKRLEFTSGIQFDTWKENVTSLKDI